MKLLITAEAPCKSIVPTDYFNFSLSLLTNLSDKSRKLLSFEGNQREILFFGNTLEKNFMQK